MANESTQTAGNAGTATAAPAAPATQAAPAAAPAPAKGGARDAWDRMGVALEDLPIIGADPAKGGEKPEPEKGEPEDDGGEPADTGAQPPAGTELKTKAGRTFKDPTELLSAYENSSTEGMRLATDLKAAKAVHESLNAKLQEASKALTEMQEYVSTTGTFPGAKSQEDVAAMTEEERYNYYSEKRSWEQKRMEYANRIKNAKTEAEDYAKQVKTTIERTEHAMAADTESYPGFTETAALRAELLKNSPHLDGRADTPYVTYFIAKGLMAGRAEAEKARLEAESQRRAKSESEAASRQAGGGAPPAGKEPAPTKTGIDRAVDAYKRRRAGF